MGQADQLELSGSGWAFLSARWERLCLFNYPVQPDRLERFLPPGLELDLLEGQAHVSLVAFDFRETCVLGVPWPGFRNFPEINLRFYVKEGERRGVAFIQELVPNPLVAWLARALYNEPYRALPMTSDHRVQGDSLIVEHEVRAQGRLQSIRVRGCASLDEPGTDDEAEFFKEHSWGYGTSRGGQLVRYEVRHPLWRTHAVESHDLDWDFGVVYGDDWEFLNEAAPRSVYLAEGSRIVVSPKLG